MMHSMAEYFEFGCNVPNLFFENLSISTAGGMVGAVAVLVAVAVCYEALRLGRKLFAVWMDKQVTLAKDDESETVQLNKGTRKYPTFIWMKYNLAQSFLHMVQVTVGYFLMLAIMTYNAWLAIAILVGLTLGFFIFAAFDTHHEGDSKTKQRSYSSKSGESSFSSVTTTIES